MTRSKWLQVTALAALAGAGFVLEGCESIREATGAVKQPPDEFTVLTKAPLVIPPDYNLRPPQPGVASRNEVDPDEQAQAALFQPSQTVQAVALGANYSEGEKVLLSKSAALGVDPSIRRTVNADAGQDDQGPQFASKVLYEGAKPPPPRAIATLQGAEVAAGPPVEEPGFFGRLFGSSDNTMAVTPIAQPVVQQQVPQPAPAVVAQGQGLLPAQPPVAPTFAPAPQVAVAQQQPAYAPAPQVVFAPQPVYAPAPQMAVQQPVAPPQPMLMAQGVGPQEQPGWFTRNFIMSPAQRAAVASGQPIPPSVSDRIQAQQQAQVAAQPVVISAAPAPQPAPAAVATQGVAPAPVVVLQQPTTVTLQPTVASVGPRPEAKNLYQYLFGAPGSAQPVQQQVLQPQPTVIVPAAQPVMPAPQPQVVQPQPQQQGQPSWWNRVFGL